MPDHHTDKKTIILGGGISGLSAAWYLHKAEIPFTLFEKEAATGGVISSSVVEDTVLDFGPNSLRDRTGALREIAEEAGIAEDLIQISEAFKTRFIVRYGELQALVTSPKALFTTKVLSAKGKLRVLAEPFIPKGPAGDESVGDFLERRIGKEVVDYLVDPIFSGIYAGDIYRMSKKEALTKPADYEQEFGSLFWGALRAEKKKNSVEPMVLSFRKGIQQLTEAISDKISEHIVHEEVTGLRKVDTGFQVQTENQMIEAERVISCLPAHSLANILEFDPQLADVLSNINYSPMLSTQVIYDESTVDIPQLGFGFLIPRKEQIRLLGAISKSTIFPELSGEGKAHFTLLTGGANDIKVLNESVGEIEKEVLKEFEWLTGIKAKPLRVMSRLWPEAIPQLEVGYGANRKQFRRAEEEYPGFHIGGNYRWGISVPDCIAGARDLSANLERGREGERE